MKNIISSETIKVLRQYFGTWGIPHVLVTDNGTSLCSEEMETFLKANGVAHIKTPPYHPATNGAAENSVKMFKNFLHKCKPGSNLNLKINSFLLKYNSSPHCTTGVSPAELHLGRKIFTALDRLTPAFRAKQSYLKKLQSNMNNYRGSHDMAFEEDSKVLVRNYGAGDKYVPGTIVEQLSPVTYSVKTGDQVVKRHTEQLLPDKRILEPQESNVSNDEDNSELVGTTKKGEEREKSFSNKQTKSYTGTVKDNKINATPVRRSNRITKPVIRMNL